MKRRQSCLAIASALLLTTSVVSAADSDIVVSHSKIGAGGSPYVGVSLGSADYDLANDSSPSFSLFAGWALNELLAVELGLADFGDVGAGIKSEASAIHASVLANTALSNEVTAFLQVGLASWDYDEGSLNDSSVDPFWGAGVDYEIGSGLVARVALQQFSIDANFSAASVEEDILNVSFGLSHHF